ncbi:chemotaxis protein CheB [Magnetospirillum sp. UT-4]|uniref:chemotaxis protein CheB n=1 Tax=Magnetospirillum sp. UT-4 TaxID=2681467 RepID=UPI00137E6FF2|nr:chemotaxis protein CheB [Magnetospirillum sp. UT-4]CAA7621472.1 Uncharacterized 104.1 kDa protein in hypE 3'region [Magnetospirillum sp. UT-4]
MTAAKGASRRKQRQGPLVVGVGASAGGLEALQKMFEPVPAASGLCFVVVQHLSPDHKSMMVELLGKHTVLDVREMADGAPVEEDVVYLLPPGKTVTIARNRLHLSAKTPTAMAGLALPIDIFLQSLAESCGTRSAGVILSGTGSDGTRGVAAIRAAGGLVVVQDPDTAKFDGMPRSVIQSGGADHVVPPELVAEVLVEHTGRSMPHLPRPRSEDVPPETFAEIASVLKRETGVDFGDYKVGTINRRVERRMQINRVATLPEYVELLRRSPLEASQLYKELLIGVTKFFRDAEAFQVLKDQVIPQIVERAGERDTIRVWVCGCATGEEAYSMAILFSEEIARTRKLVEVKIFATDLDRDAIEIASLGVYEDSALAEVPADIKGRYFIARGDRWAVARQIRQMIVFARHNILKDPPFTKLDLVSCRNLLIYMEPVLQRRVLSLFNYALNRGAFLFLGSSESLGELAAQYAVIDVKHKVFRTVSTGASLPDGIIRNLPTASASASAAAAAVPRPRHPGLGGDEDMAIDQGLGLLIETFAPPALLLNDRGDLLHVFGDGSRFLRVPPGHATLDVMKLLPSALATVAGSALHKALRDGKEIEYASVPYNAPGGIELVTLKVRPFVQQSGKRYALLAIIPQAAATTGDEPARFDAGADASDRIRTLEHDLKTSQESLQATVEELETSNEELQASNEELLASNEELQSTNEELQSVNEELFTLNSQYEAKIEELTRVSDDIENLLRATDLGTVFLDTNLIVRRFTPAAAACVNLIPRDVGRSFAHLSTNLQYPGMLEDIREVLRTGRATQHEVRATGNRFVLVGLLPYLTDAGGDHEKRAGVVVTFVDVTEVKQAEQRLQAVIDALPEQVAVLDPNGIVTFTNSAWDAAARAGFVNLAGTPRGQDFLAACRDYPGAGGDPGLRVSEGMSDILAGRRDRFSIDYACGPPAQMRLGILNAAPIAHMGLVISHVLVSRGGSSAS